MGNTFLAVSWFGLLGALFGYFAPEIFFATWHGSLDIPDIELAKTANMAAGSGAFGGALSGYCLARFFSLEKPWFTTFLHSALMLIIGLPIATLGFCLLESIRTGNVMPLGFYVVAPAFLSYLVAIFQGKYLFPAVLFSVRAYYYIVQTNELKAH